MPRDGVLPVPGSDWLEPFERWAPQKRLTRDRQPLILSGHGVRMRIDRSSLFVQNGFTRYPQQREEWRFFPGDWRLPSRIVVIDSDGSLTFDVLAWLSEQRIPLVQVDWRGHATVVGGGASYVGDFKLVAAQRAAQANPKHTMAISRWLIAEKIARSRETLTRAVEPSPPRERALEELAASDRELKTRPLRTKDGLRGIEGRVAQAYFTAWRSLPLRWKGIARKPIPEDWHRIGSRVSPESETNRQATHPVNAMLNYGYAILESQIRMAVTAAGLDPTIGFMHAQHRGRAAFVLDLMEPLRPAIDETVLHFVGTQTFSPADFTISSKGICRLHSQLARRVVGEVLPFDGLGPIISDLPKRFRRVTACD